MKASNIMNKIGVARKADVLSLATRMTNLEIGQDTLKMGISLVGGVAIPALIAAVSANTKAKQLHNSVAEFAADTEDTEKDIHIKIRKMETQLDALKMQHENLFDSIQKDNEVVRDQFDQHVDYNNHTNKRIDEMSIQCDAQIADLRDQLNKLKEEIKK